MDLSNGANIRLPLETTLAACENAEFVEIFEQVLQDAATLFITRARERDISAPIWHKMPFGDFSFATFIEHKSARMCQMLISPELGAMNPKIDDELIDIIVFSAAMLAYRKLGRLQELRRDSGVVQ